MSERVSEKALHAFIMPNGKHRGTRLVRVPVGYLRWMCTSGHELAHYAKAEMIRRGVAIPNFDVSGHAIDRLSQHSLGTWAVARMKDEGIHSWLVRICNDALEAADPDILAQSEFQLERHGLFLCFSKDGEWPVLKTIKRMK